MSHKPTVPSALGTPLADQTVGEIVAANPNLSRVFQAYDIGFCCQGKLTLRTACERNNVDLEQMLATLEQEAGRELLPSEDVTSFSLSELVDHIIEQHHGFLRSELPRIHAMAERVAHVHGGHTPSLLQVYEVFTEMGQALAEYSENEETVLFPEIRNVPERLSDSSSLEDKVSCIMNKHASTSAALARLRELTNNYTPPTDACNTYRALFAGLADLETDTARHIHLENDLLFPRALQHP